MNEDDLDTISTKPARRNSEMPPVEADSQVNQLVSRAGDLASQTLEQAQRLGSSAKERLVQEADDKKAKVARKLEDFAESMDELGTNPQADPLQQKVVGGAARAMRSVSRALDENSTEELIASAGRAIRRRPGLFLAGCVALGFLGGRMLRR